MPTPERILRIESNNSQVELTSLEKEVLEALAQGLKNREIAIELRTPPEKIVWLISKLYSQFKINGYHQYSRFHLAGRAIKYGHLPPETDLSSLAPPPIPFVSRKLEKDQLLTHREKEILIWAVLGLKNKEIAEKLERHQRTVANHITSAFRKLEVDGRTELVAKTLSEDLVDSEALREKFASQIARLETLSDREKEVLEEVAKGFFDKEIARKLGGISSLTVKNHITNILKKLRVKNRTQAALIYFLEHPPLKPTEEEAIFPSHEKLRE